MVLRAMPRVRLKEHDVARVGDDGAADAKVWHIAAREGSSAARVRQIEYEAAMCAFDGLVEAPSNLARLRHRVRCEP